MTLLRLRFVHRFRDRHGHLRHYLRRPGCKRVPLPGLPGSPEFMAAYHLAIAAPGEPAPSAITPPPPPGSFEALAISWLRTPAFTQLRGSTRAVYRRILDRLRAEHGPKPIAALTPKHVRDLVALRAATPAAANHVLRIFRLLMQHAVEQGLRDTDPTRDVKRLREAGAGIPDWPEADIARFEAHWPIGSRPRLALALLLYTGQRRSDVVRMGRQHLRGQVIEVRQVKTGAQLLLPLHPELLRALEAAVPRDQLIFLVTEAGVPFTSGGFYNAFRDWARAAGLPPGRSPHGLRKAAARRLAEAGCTTHEIAAVTGHRTLAEVARYTRAAEQARLADAAIMRIGGKPEG